MKFFEIFITILLCVMVACACVVAYRHIPAYFNGEATEINLIDNGKVIEKVPADPIFTLANYPKVDASSATQPLVNAFIRDFTGEDIDVDKLEYTNTHSAYEKLINGDVDLIVVTEPSEEELELAEENGIELEVIPVVKEGFVFFVNEKNTVKSLTLEEVQDIYAGEITNWRDVGGKNSEIRAFQRPANSGSQTGMLSLVMIDKEITEPLTEDLMESMDSIVNIVSSYDNGEDAIGYSYYYYVNTMFSDIDSDVQSKIKLLQIDGIEPNSETIKSGEYILQTAYYIVINKEESEGGNTRKLLEAMLSTRGQAVAEEIGYVGI